MPIYEYRCKKCGQVSEFLEETGSSTKHVCQHCGRRAVEQVFSVFSAKVSTGSSSGTSSSCPTGTCPLS